MSDGKTNNKLLQLGMQLNVGFPDLNAETYDLNRRPDESWSDYLHRLIKSRTMNESKCVGIEEFVPLRQMALNTKIKTHKNTYYFSLATGNRNKQREKAREVLREPTKLLQSLYGLDLNVRELIKF